jgi:hypothetical protein
VAEGPTEGGREPQVKERMIPLIFIRPCQGSLACSIAPRGSQKALTPGYFLNIPSGFQFVVIQKFVDGYAGCENKSLVTGQPDLRQCWIE